MSKRTKTIAESLEDLAERGAPDGTLDNELWDACYSDAKRTHETITETVLLEQLEFLHARGYTIARLSDIIKEAKSE